MSDIVTVVAEPEIINIEIVNDEVVSVDIQQQEINVEISDIVYTGNGIPVEVFDAKANRLISIAGENIGGHRAVLIKSDDKVYYADKDEITHLDKVAGLTQSAVNAGDKITIYGSNEVIEETSFDFDTTKPIYLGNNGLLTQVIPVTGFLQIVAIPITNKKIRVDIHQPIKI